MMRPNGPEGGVGHRAAANITAPANTTADPHADANAAMNRAARPAAARNAHILYRWVASVGGAGLLPGMPGTYGSFVTSLGLLLIYVGLSTGRTSGGLDRSPSAASWSAVLVAGLLLSSALDVALGKRVLEVFGKKDPGSFVLDEAAGICLTMLAQPMLARWHEAIPLAAGFVAFRIFDIWKPPPARALEKLPLGWGILMDDLMAAVYANLLCQVVLRLALKMG